MKALVLSTVLLAASLQTVSAFAADLPQRAPARQGGKIYGDATRGKEIVGKWCVTCHSVGAPTDDRVPALTALAANPSKTDGVIRAFSNASEHEFSAEAIQDCTLIRYRRRDTDTLIKSDAAFACELQTLTAKGLSSAYAHMVRLCHRSAHDRVAWFLLSMSERAETDDGWIALPMTRVDIADYLGMAHETVSRAFTQLKKSRAIVEPTFNRIKLVNRAALEGALDA